MLESSLEVSVMIGQESAKSVLFQRLSSKSDQPSLLIFFEGTNPKSLKILQKSEPGAPEESFYKHLGHMPPKNWILHTFGNALGAQDDHFASNLEAQDFPKSMQEREKVNVQK